MPVKAIPKVSLARNGIGAFVRPCYKVTLQYCNWGGSSQGMRDFLTQEKTSLAKFASEFKDVFFEIKQQNGHPQLLLHFNNGKKQSVDVRNQSVSEISKKLWESVQQSGNDRFKFNQKVMSNNESVRGIWSPLHVAKENRHKI
ncbi:hypothetical protein FT663_02877 [Candidozyma haemuli var. vulneris]|uniref:Large ribosomal subunit protein mL43 n=1 Tax=Candidozyma haemuli TaxID=45357 RepID=A0A2V1AW27_9ASCO|nr:hypothetical protein CXQ85_005338 [[Candida] haemuloni]KAF3989567.1 hypothetical protein FT662_02737 [[Candida] haemuloni var. vulneris]KAF3991150.1 hypothetical protein FT663_02877 [[Candida] haemuloni var. vulneris]PVH22310.1 hypothetical protein CXQ85_005338 [[Candida] haemuloni]